MRRDKEMRSRSFETDTTFNSQNRIAEMNASPDPIPLSDRVQGVNDRDRDLRLSIDLRRHTFLKSDGHRLRWKCRINFFSRISIVGQMLRGVVCLLSADTRTPHSLVDAVLL